MNNTPAAISSNPPVSQPPEFFPTRSIFALLLGTLVLRIASAIIGALIQFYFGYIDKHLYPLSDTMRGLALALFFLPELIGAPVLGAWSDRFGRKLFIQFAALCGLLGTIIPALTSVFALLVITRLLGGLSTASQFPATLGYLSSATNQSHDLRGRVIGLFQIVTLAGTVGGIFLAGRLWDTFGQNAFLIAAAVYLVSFLIFALGISETPPKSKLYIPFFSGDRAGRQALRDSLAYYQSVFFQPAILRFAPAWLAINMILGIWMNHTIGQLIASRTLFPAQSLYGMLSDHANAGNLVSTYGAILLGLFATGVLVWSLMLGRWRRTSVMLAAIGALFVLCAILYLLNHMDLSDPSIPLMLPIALASFFILSGAMPAALTYLADITESRADDRGAIMGLYTIFFGIGGFLGTLIGGPFADWAAVDGILTATVGLALVALITLLQLHRHETKSP